MVSKCVALVLAAAAVHADEVSLLKAESRVHGRYGYKWQTVSADIVVENKAYEKDVVVVAEGPDGETQELHASYIESYANNNKELWRMSQQWYIGKRPGSGLPAELQSHVDLNFKLRYTVDGKTYWANNTDSETGNYHVEALSGERITNNVYVDHFVARKYGDSPRTMEVGVFVQNLGFHKQVTVRYSADNWASYKEASLGFQYGKLEGYSYTQYPNSNGAEYWYASIHDDMLQHAPNTVRFAVSYTVNGQTYWDNKFGQDYALSY
eukprot:TRINITY_DN7537_c0_g1_i1.p1 TRINITY_DN7537_c0_g1~~TRINITY_DN7537_c0_g1_i1.p1  ORF type:complete len:266 (+),score=124.08 TRINITY_DN7537_c0_g1_i1:106-903(+)